jgi:RHS repeat-associated protein
MQNSSSFFQGQARFSNGFFGVYHSPFGVELKGRNLKKNNAKNYRFGFNGMEADDQVKGDGNSYDFGARMLDPRLGRWLSVDPKFTVFSSIATYASCNNNPMYYVDPDGNIITPSDAKSKQDFNSCILRTLSGNEIALKLFTIIESNSSVSNISEADLILALNATESIDQRAVIMTLYHASNSKTDYVIKSIEPGKASNKVDFADGYQMRNDGAKVEILVSLQEALSGNNKCLKKFSGHLYYRIS